MENVEKTDIGGNQTTVDWKSAGIPEFHHLNPLEKSVDQSLINCYQEDGALLMPGLFQDWVEPLRRGLQRNLNTPSEFAFPCESTPTGAPGRFFDSYCNWLLIEEYFEHVTQSVAASVAGQLMGSEESQFFHEHAFCKEPGTQQPTPWHQDLSYYCVDGKQTVSLYVALDTIPKDVAVQFVRGSHRWGQVFHPVGFLDGSKFQSRDKSMQTAPAVDRDPSRYEIIAWDLEPGDCIAFNFLTLHGTTSGLVRERRRAISTRWLGDDVVYCERGVETSPPYPGIGLNPGQRMRIDWFPVLWHRKS